MTVLCENAGVHRCKKAQIESKASLYSRGVARWILYVYFCACVRRRQRSDRLGWVGMEEVYSLL